MQHSKANRGVLRDIVSDNDELQPAEVGMLLQFTAQHGECFYQPGYVFLRAHGACVEQEGVVDLVAAQKLPAAFSAFLLQLLWCPVGRLGEESGIRGVIDPADLAAGNIKELLHVSLGSARYGNHRVGALESPADDSFSPFHTPIFVLVKQQET